MLYMDMDSGSESDYTDDKLRIIDNDSDTDSERLITEQQVPALPLPQSGHLSLGSACPSSPTRLPAAQQGGSAIVSSS